MEEKIRGGGGGERRGDGGKDKEGGEKGGKIRGRGGREGEEVGRIKLHKPSSLREGVGAGTGEGGKLTSQTSSTSNCIVAATSWLCISIPRAQGPSQKTPTTHKGFFFFFFFSFEK